MSEPSIGGNSAKSLADVKSKLIVDVSKLATVRVEVDKLNTALKKTLDYMTKIGTASTHMSRGVKGAVGSAGGTPMSGGGYSVPGLTTPVATTPTPSGGGMFSRIRGLGGGGAAAGGGGGPTAGGATGYLTGAGGSFYAMVAAGNLVGSAVKTIDNRVNDNMAYALPADRLSLVQQQMTGMTQQQVQKNTRQPLTQYKLGADGVNTLLSNQVRYGINAQQQGAGFEALRAVSGYSLNTQDLVGIQNQLTSPQVANRMFNLMGGFNFNGPNGTTKDLFTGIKQIGKLNGLGDPNILRGAFEQGSRTRGNLANLGVDAPTQDLILKYAQDNQTFKSKGGKGDYNPQTKADRKLMGTDSNFATQSEETNRLSAVRNENMYRDQASSYAALEKSNQQLISAMGSLEHTFSSLIGLRTRTRPWQKVAGGLLKGVGVAASLLGAPEVGVPAFLAGAAIGDGPVSSPKPAGTAPTPVTISGSGDSTNDANIQVPTGYGGKTGSLADIKQNSSFKAMKPLIQDRLLRAMREHPSLGFGQGFRSMNEQKQLFLSRYRRTDAKTDIQWDGSYWEHVSGAPAAPPGMSMHGAGLAADMVGDLGWLQANATRFGLKTFATVNGEPWHVQPLEMPNSYSAYAKSAGVADPTAAATSPSSGFGTSGPASVATGDSAQAGASTSNGWSAGSHANNFTGQSIQDILNTVSGERPHGTGATGGFGGKKGSPAATSSASSSATVAAMPSGLVAGISQLSGAQVAQMAFNAGFRGQDLINMVAISKRESGWKPGSVNMKGVDNSFGLWQINMKGSLGPARLKQFGLTSNDQLYDPATNARAAFIVSGGGHNLGPWGIKGDPFAKTDVAGATKIVSDAGLGSRGDPMPSDMANYQPTGGGSMSPVSSRQTIQVHSKPQITVPMTFTFMGAPASVDIKKIAAEVKAQVEDALEMAGMRQS